MISLDSIPSTAAKPHVRQQSCTSYTERATVRLYSHAVELLSGRDTERSEIHQHHSLLRGANSSMDASIGYMRVYNSSRRATAPLWAVESPSREAEDTSLQAVIDAEGAQCFQIVVIARNDHSLQPLAASHHHFLDVGFSGFSGVER
jgi:hypothetical protein